MSGNAENDQEEENDEGGQPRDAIYGNNETNSYRGRRNRNPIPGRRYNNIFNQNANRESYLFAGSSKKEKKQFIKRRGAAKAIKLGAAISTLATVLKTKLGVKDRSFKKSEKNNKKKNNWHDNGKRRGFKRKRNVSNTSSPHKKDNENSENPGNWRSNQPSTSRGMNRGNDRNCQRAKEDAEEARRKKFQDFKWSGYNTGELESELAGVMKKFKEPRGSQAHARRAEVLLALNTDELLESFEQPYVLATEAGFLSIDQLQMLREAFPDNNHVLWKMFNNLTPEMTNDTMLNEFISNSMLYREVVKRMHTRRTAAEQKAIHELICKSRDLDLINNDQWIRAVGYGVMYLQLREKIAELKERKKQRRHGGDVQCSKAFESAGDECGLLPAVLVYKEAAVRQDCSSNLAEMEITNLEYLVQINLLRMLRCLSANEDNLNIHADLKGLNLDATIYSDIQDPVTQDYRVKLLVHFANVVKKIAYTILCRNVFASAGYSTMVMDIVGNRLTVEKASNAPRWPAWRAKNIAENKNDPLPLKLSKPPAIIGKFAMQLQTGSFSLKWSSIEEKFRDVKNTILHISEDIMDGLNDEDVGVSIEHGTSDADDGDDGRGGGNGRGGPGGGNGPGVGNGASESIGGNRRGGPGVGNSRGAMGGRISRGCRRGRGRANGQSGANGQGTQSSLGGVTDFTDRCERESISDSSNVRSTTGESLNKVAKDVQTVNGNAPGNEQLDNIETDDDAEFYTPEGQELPSSTTTSTNNDKPYRQTSKRARPFTSHRNERRPIPRCNIVPEGNDGSIVRQKQQPTQRSGTQGSSDANISHVLDSDDDVTEISTVHRSPEPRMPVSDPLGLTSFRNQSDPSDQRSTTTPIRRFPDLNSNGPDDGSGNRASNKPRSSLPATSSLSGDEQRQQQRERMSRASLSTGNERHTSSSNLFQTPRDMTGVVIPVVSPNFWSKGHLRTALKYSELNATEMLRDVRVRQEQIRRICRSNVGDHTMLRLIGQQIADEITYMQGRLNEAITKYRDYKSEYENPATESKRRHSATHLSRPVANAISIWTPYIDWLRTTLARIREILRWNNKAAMDRTPENTRAGGDGLFDDDSPPTVPVEPRVLEHSPEQVNEPVYIPEERYEGEFSARSLPSSSGTRASRESNRDPLGVNYDTAYLCEAAGIIAHNIQQAFFKESLEMQRDISDFIRERESRGEEGREGEDVEDDGNDVYEEGDEYEDCEDEEQEAEGEGVEEEEDYYQEDGYQEDEGNGYAEGFPCSDEYIDDELIHERGQGTRMDGRCVDLSNDIQLRPTPMTSPSAASTSSFFGSKVTEFPVLYSPSPPHDRTNTLHVAQYIKDPLRPTSMPTLSKIPSTSSIGNSTASTSNQQHPSNGSTSPRPITRHALQKDILQNYYRGIYPDDIHRPAIGPTTSGSRLESTANFPQPSPRHKEAYDWLGGLNPQNNDDLGDDHDQMDCYETEMTHNLEDDVFEHDEEEQEEEEEENGTAGAEGEEDEEKNLSVVTRSQARRKRFESIQDRVNRLLGLRPTARRTDSLESLRQDCTTEPGPSFDMKGSTSTTSLKGIGKGKESKTDKQQRENREKEEKKAKKKEKEEQEKRQKEEKKTQKKKKDKINENKKKKRNEKDSDSENDDDDVDDDENDGNYHKRSKGSGGGK